jgi:hypothetical protein
MKKQKKNESARTQRRREQRRQRKEQLKSLATYRVDLNDVGSCDLVEGQGNNLTDEEKRALKERNYNEEAELAIRSQFDSDEEMNEYKKSLDSKGFTHAYAVNLTDSMSKGYKFLDKRFAPSEKDVDEVRKVLNDGGVVIMYYSEDHVEAATQGENGNWEISRVFGLSAA